MSLNYFCNEKCFRQNCGENQNIHFTVNHLYANMLMFMG